MAKKKEPSDMIEKAKFWNEMKEETIHAILAILAFVLTLLSLLASFGKAGELGNYGYMFFTRILGIGYFLIPLLSAMIGIALLQGLEKKFRTSKTVGAFIFFLSSLGLIHIIGAAFGDADTRLAGIFGYWVAAPLIKIVAVPASSILLVALVIISVFILFEMHITAEQMMFWKWFNKTKKEEERNGKKEKEIAIEMDADEEENIDAALAANALAAAEMQRNAKVPEVKIRKTAKKDDFDEAEDTFKATAQAPLLKPFTPPPLTLLEKDRGKPETGDIKATANLIKRTLQNFNISVEMDEISIGPSVTRYALKPAEGVKLSRIVALNDNLALALAAHPIRIEAPIPGKSLVGMEVPNTAKTTVGLATLLASNDFQGSDKPLLISLGKDITGKAHFANLAKSPHALIAGATGSGKSVTIHTLITSLLYRNSPENLRFVMIDPKRVELTLYNKIPHLLTPVITNPKQAILALKHMGKEMARRYDILEKNSVQNIDSYHKTVLAPAVEAMKKETDEEAKAELTSKLPESMPYIVIVIDELADIMQTYPRELESAIVRLAQMSRAVGIHLVLSTQRPSVNVITGLIKANVPTRIALQVASQIDSRTILDQPGAEKLLGAGDMLYLGGEMSKPIRLQSAFISESEVKRVVKFLQEEYKDEIMSGMDLGINTAETSGGSNVGGMSSMDLDSGSLEDDDDYYEQAREIVVGNNKASTSFLQRKLGVGYSRAAKLMDMLEERGVIGPANGSKAREIIGGVGGGMEQSDGGMAMPEGEKAF
ncbi:MAG TPA: DNA translocase FtsK 4TM domain-containing protein [Candidatus Paceibacterota bacterium]|jgi:S-DNA-T family DNA segregation ATPase FtsK/SpoIIIE|nr:DNA translocase FtsK 4TM domain-containing protein [Candidatus Paceibacterota bacterium]